MLTPPIGVCRRELVLQTSEHTEFASTIEVLLELCREFFKLCVFRRESCRYRLLHIDIRGLVCIGSEIGLNKKCASPVIWFYSYPEMALFDGAFLTPKSSFNHWRGCLGDWKYPKRRDEFFTYFG